LFLLSYHDPPIIEPSGPHVKRGRARGSIWDPGVDWNPSNGSSDRWSVFVRLSSPVAMVLRARLEEAPWAARCPICDVGVCASALRTGYFVYLVGYRQKAISDNDSFLAGAYTGFGVAVLVRGELGVSHANCRFEQLAREVLQYSLRTWRDVRAGAVRCQAAQSEVTQSGISMASCIMVRSLRSHLSALASLSVNSAKSFSLKTRLMWKLGLVVD